MGSYGVGSNSSSLNAKIIEHKLCHMNRSKGKVTV